MLLRSLFFLLFVVTCFLNSTTSLTKSACSTFSTAHHKETIQIDQQVQGTYEADTLDEDVCETCDGMFAKNILPIRSTEVIIVANETLYHQVFYSGYYTDFSVELPPPKI